MRRRVILRDREEGSAASIATVLLVVLVAAMMAIVSVFVFGLVKLPEDPPEVEVVYSQLNDRWSAHVSGVSDERPISEFRLAVRGPDGNYILYDDDRDGIADGLMSMKLDTVTSSSGGGPQISPVVYVDVDGDGKVSSGDALIATSNFLPSNSLLIDATRGYKLVGLDPHGIPLDSDLVVVATDTTLVASGLSPGDEVHLEIKHGSTLEATRHGHATAAGAFITDVYMDPAWHTGNHKAEFTVRPGMFDEFTATVIFHSKVPEPLTEAEEEAYELLKHPLETGDVVSLIHVPTNSVVIDYRL
ncbi:MAG: type IV pilin N-terminal domain-containing protein [Thermoplasmata archaeon]|nr:MAG: type IV pilin N-terminal domain-containing protein [Thermoplasmata archaeon]